MSKRAAKMANPTQNRPRLIMFKIMITIQNVIASNWGIQKNRAFIFDMILLLSEETKHHFYYLF